MPRWEYKDVYYAQVINKTLQYVLWPWKKTTNTCKNQIFFRKMGEESVEAI